MINRAEIRASLITTQQEYSQLIRKAKNKNKNTTTPTPKQDSHPYHAPVHPRMEKRAVEKVAKYRDKSHAFHNVEQDIEQFLANAIPGNDFGRTFVEYVLLEECYLRFLRFYPPPKWWSFLQRKQMDSYVIMEKRRECRKLHGVNPQYHALAYRGMIRQSLLKSGLNNNEFARFLGPASSQQNDGIVRDRMDRPVLERTKSSRELLQLSSMQTLPSLL